MKTNINKNRKEKPKERIHFNKNKKEEKLCSVCILEPGVERNQDTHSPELNGRKTYKKE